MKQVPKSTVGRRVPEHKSTGPNATIDLLREGLKQSAVHVNLGQEMIILTEDRLRLELNELSDSTKHRQGWHAPAGMLITEVAALVTSSFHDTIGISGQQWQAFFRTLIVLTVIWLLVAFVRGRRSFSADSLIGRLKTGQPRRDQGPTKDYTA